MCVSAVPLETVIAKMTDMSAKRMNIANRGLLAEGYFADVNIFDLHSIKDNATFAEPTKLASGIDKCFVNGVLAVDDGKVVSRDAGVVIRAGIIKRFLWIIR